MWTRIISPAPVRRSAIASALLFALLCGAEEGRGQEALGVPFIGAHHLSFYTTNLSRDGVGAETAAVYGGVYGHRFGDRNAIGEMSLVGRIGARALEGKGDGILDAGLTVAATRAVPRLSQLSITGAIGVGAMSFGQEASEETEVDRGHLSVRVPMAAGMAYDVRVGGATVAPFAAVNPVYTSERDYLDDERISTDGGWDVGASYGISVRFREAVLSLSSIHNERGIPENNRIMFNAGLSW